MRILIDMNHPAHVHLFRNFIKQMEKKGHEFFITARDKECTFDLLKAYDINFIPRKGFKGLFGKTVGMIKIDIWLYKRAKKFNPDIMIGGPGNCYISQVGWLLKKPSFIFDDTEHSTIQNWITFPFATKIITPSCFTINLGKKQVKYNSFHDFAYLHPNNFSAKKIKGFPKNYIVVRFVDWQASHDLGDYGITDKIGFVRKLQELTTIFVSTEEKMIPNDIKKITIKNPSEEMHDILANAKLVVGESATMVSEATALGVPAIFVGQTSRGYIEEEKERKLVFHYKNQENAFNKIIDIYENETYLKEYKKRYQKLLKDKIDLTEWMINYFQKYIANNIKQ